MDGETAMVTVEVSSRARVGERVSVVLGLGTRSSVSDERSGLKSDSERKASVGLAVLTGTRKGTE